MTARRPTGINLKEAAVALDVHYMTAYRYVRTGRLPATRALNGWVVDVDDVAAFAAARDGAGPGGVGQAGHGADWRERLRRTLVVGDETAAWRVLEQALAAGRSPADCY